MFEGFGMVLGVLLGLIILAVAVLSIIFIFKHAYILIFAGLFKSLIGGISEKKKHSSKKKSSKK